ncbi:hypothetical protein CKA32_004605 [Geitlerinema sp. FC II]|nr:hypothetical protein CKA32_004605 [Geitlerinema sp. FC II]
MNPLDYPCYVSFSTIFSGLRWRLVYGDFSQNVLKLSSLLFLA